MRGKHVRGHRCLTMSLPPPHPSSLEEEGRVERGET